MRKGLGRDAMGVDSVNKQQLAERLGAWLTDDALPFWQRNGVDRRYGGFIEALTFDGEDAGLPFKRTRVTCRQVYVYAHAARLGWRDGTDLIHHGATWLMEKAWQGGGLGFARRLHRDGEVLDPTPDLYDHAFALFAFAWAYDATGDETYRRWIDQTADFIERCFAVVDGDGYWHTSPPEGPRQQNPHMHLCESMLSAFAATGEQRYADKAAMLADLCRRKFYQSDTGTLAEFFKDDLTLAKGEQGALREPGHHFEWIWLLNAAQAAQETDDEARMKALMTFGEKYGVHEETKTVFNAVDQSGGAMDAGSRCWPNTERMKAAVALIEAYNIDAWDVVKESTDALFKYYLTPSPSRPFLSGGWNDAIDASGAPMAQNMPASTFYHLFLAMVEVRRVAGINHL